MGNTNSGGGWTRPPAWTTHPPPPPPSHPHQNANNSYVFAAASPYPNPYPNPSTNHPTGYYPYPPPMQPGYIPPQAPMPLPGSSNWPAAGPGGSYPIPYGAPMMPLSPPPPYVEHQKAVTIRNDVNVKKETLRIEPDHDNPGHYLVAFTFDATVPGSITVMFFAKEGEDCKLISTVESLNPPVTVPFQQGLGQKFRQASGTGIEFSRFDLSELLRNGEGDVCPLAVKTESSVVNQTETDSDENPDQGSTESQITQAVFCKEEDEYKVKVLKQILWVNKTRYELQEIYGIGNSMEGEMDGNESLKECVICLNAPRDTTLLPCRHMCLCSECAKVLRFHTNRCPICRQPIDRFLEIKVSNGEDDEETSIS